jgi:hypothetical protein
MGYNTAGHDTAGHDAVGYDASRQAPSLKRRPGRRRHHNYISPSC